MLTLVSWLLPTVLALAPVPGERRFARLVPGYELKTCYADTDHFSGSYFPERLGGRLRNLETWNRFQELLKPVLEAENRARQLRDQPEYDSSQFCADPHPGLTQLNSLSIVCEDLMDQAYAEFSKRDEALMPVGAKWMRVRGDARIGIDQRDGLDPKSVTEERRKGEGWWTGSCHLQPVIEGLYPNPPDSVTLGGETFTGDELERLALNFAALFTHKTRLSGSNNRAPKPSELLSALSRLDPSHPVCLAGDFDRTDELWNYRIFSVQVTERTVDAAGEILRIRVFYGKQAEPHEDLWEIRLPADADGQLGTPVWISEPKVQFIWWFEPKFEWKKSLLGSPDTKMEALYREFYRQMTGGS